MSGLEFFYSSCLPTIFRHGGLHATANGLPLKGLEVFDQSCVCSDVFATMTAVSTLHLCQ